MSSFPLRLSKAGTVMNASDIMARSVVSVGPDASIGEAIRLMLDHRISGLPVVDAAGKLAGMLTEGDLMRRTETRTERQRPRWIEFLRGPGRLSLDYVHTHGRKVGDLMTREVFSVRDDASLPEIVGLMERHRVKRLPVLKGGNIVGIVTRADLMRALAALIDETGGAAAVDDEIIRKNVLASLAEAIWSRHLGIKISVAGGIVTLDGAILDENERQGLRIAAENVPGVKGVRDRIVGVEPVSGIIIEAP
jgi:CBS domain-containing protein